MFIFPGGSLALSWDNSASQIFFFHVFLSAALPSRKPSAQWPVQNGTLQDYPEPRSHHMIQACHSFMVLVSMSAEKKPT